MAGFVAVIHPACPPRTAERTESGVLTTVLPDEGGRLGQPWEVAGVLPLQGSSFRQLVEGGAVRHELGEHLQRPLADQATP